MDAAIDIGEGIPLIMSARISIASPAGYAIPAIIEEPEGRPANGTVVMTHGIFSTKDENGRYPRQARIHHDQGRRTVRFDWQGHGDHPIDFELSSVAGNVDDLQTVFDYATVTWADPLYIVASSFGASIFLMHRMLPDVHDVRRALLLNPVTDYRHTFYSAVGGELADHFGEQTWQQVWKNGRAELLPGKTMSRRLGIELLTETPYLGFTHLRIPTLVVHGTADASVSSEVTERNAGRSANVRFEAVEGADHAFAADWEERATFRLIRDWFAE